MAARQRFAVSLLLCVWTFVVTTPATANPLNWGQQDRSLLPASKAFVPVSAVWREGMVMISIRVEPGHYLYRHTVVLEAPPGVLTLPEGSPYHDDFFGDVMIFREWITASLALDQAPKAVTVSYQGCADVGVCYPPQTTTLPVSVARR